MRFVHRLTSAGRRAAADLFMRSWGDPFGGASMRRRLGGIALLLVVAVVSCTPAATTPPKPSGKEFGPAPIPITSALVAQGSIAATLVYSGNVQSRSQVNVVPKITGRVERLYVDIGDEVRQGEVIAELDRAALDAQVQQAEAAVSVAQARLQQVQAGSKAGGRAEQIAAARAQVGQAQSRLDAILAGPKPDDAAGLDAAIDQSRAQVDQSRAQLASAQATMTEARFRLEQARAGLGGPNTRAEDIAAAQAALNAARSRLDNLRAGARPEDIRAAELAVQRTRVNVAAADAALEACGRTVTTNRSRNRNEQTGQTTTSTSQSRQSCSSSQEDQ